MLGQRYCVNSLGFSFRWLLGLGYALFSQRTRLIFSIFFFHTVVGLQGSQAG